MGKLSAGITPEFKPKGQKQLKGLILGIKYKDGQPRIGGGTISKWINKDKHSIMECEGTE